MGQKKDSFYIHIGHIYGGHAKALKIKYIIPFITCNQHNNEQKKNTVSINQKLIRPSLEDIWKTEHGHVPILVQLFQMTRCQLCRQKIYQSSRSENQKITNFITHANNFSWYPLVKARLAALLKMHTERNYLKYSLVS